MQLLRLSKMTALGLAFLGSSIQANAQVVHEDIAIYASDAGALVANPEPGLNAVFKNDGVCFTEACLYSTVNPGIITPSSSFGTYDPVQSGTLIRMEIVEIDPAVTIKVGAATLDAPGESASLGTASSIHIHPSYQVVVPENQLGEYPVRFRFVADSGHGPSPVYELRLSNQASATPTPTPTATPTPAPTATPTPTPTMTPPPTPTATPTSTPTATPTPTPAATPTPMSTPGATAAPTPVPTNSPTPGGPTDTDVGTLEIPAAGSIQSGIGLVSGWKCTSNGLTARFDGGEELPISYGTPRGDTRGLCQDPQQENTAFALQWNYSNLEDGAHSLEILDGGEVWRTVLFEVQRVAGSRFLRGVERCSALEDFPYEGDIQFVEWQQASQSFVLVDGCSPSVAEPGTERINQTDFPIPGALENPGPGASMSGIGVVSGWRCAGGDITARFDDREAIPVAYGTPRDDTRGQCADPKQVNNAYVLQWNYALLGDGEHTLRLYDGGVEFASTTFRVTTLGSPFVRDLAAEYLIEEFPAQGQAVILEWQQSRQGFGVVVSED